MNGYINNMNISNIFRLLMKMDGKDDSDHILFRNDFVCVYVVPHDKLAGTLNLYYNTGQMLEFMPKNISPDDLIF